MPSPSAPRFPISTPVNVRPPRQSALVPATPFGAPPGAQDVLPDLMRLRTGLERAVMNRLERAGYACVDVPTYEPFSLFGPRYGDQLRERLFTFYADREYALRPDLTGSVGRLVAGGAFRGQSAPLRLCYAGQAFRYERLEAGVLREFRQAGLELLGAVGEAADLEVLSVALEALAPLAPGELEVRLHHVEILPRLIETLVAVPTMHRSVDADLRRWATLPRGSAAAERLEHELRIQWHDVLGEDTAERLLALGRFEGTVAGARQLELPMSASSVLERLLSVTETLERLGQARVTVAPVGAMGLGYYSGLWFEVRLHSGGTSCEIARGGRYDHLVRDLGGDIEGGIGLAIQLDALARACLAANPAPALRYGRVMASDEGARARAARLAKSLRDRGQSVIVELEPLALDQVIERGRAVDARWVVLVEPEGAFRVWSPERGEPQVVEEEALDAWLEG